MGEACLRQALEMVRNSSVIDEAYELAIHYRDRALDSLAVLEGNSSKESLEQMVLCLIEAR